MADPANVISETLFKEGGKQTETYLERIVSQADEADAVRKEGA